MLLTICKYLTADSSPVWYSN